MNPTDRFATLWESDASPPDVFAFLRNHVDLPPRQCADILLIDQHHRSRAGAGLPAEVYLREFPAVAADPELKLDLVFGELCHRAEVWSAACDLSEYVSRFPDLGDALRRQIEVARWLEGGSGSSRLGAGPTIVHRPPAVVEGTLDARDQALEHEPIVPHGPGSASGSAGSPAGEVRGAGLAPGTENLEILERLGEGGMGVVYRARQPMMDRVVALKIIHSRAHADSRQRARFQTEIKAIARLSHPHFVQIYEIGERDGLPYFLMEYVGGGNLARKLTGGPLPWRQSAQLVETLARAMAFAHAQGIVHRDLKPSNILLTLDGQPKISDFGLAKISSAEDAGLSIGGEVIGTPSYMAPEQAEGHAAAPANDVFSLGATLYEMLTGRPPFRGKTVYGTLLQVMHQDAAPPGRLRSRLPRELETICLKCLAKEPQRRYASCTDLAEDLHAFLSGEPIRARRAPAWESWIRELYRKPGRAILLGALAVAGACLLLGVGRSNALAVSGIAALGLIAGGSWFQWRLLALVRVMERQQVVMERYAERLQMLGEMSRQLIAVTDLDRLLWLLGETAARLANAELATLYLIDRERGVVRSKVKLGHDIGEICIPLGQGIAGTVAVTGQLINLRDAYADPRFHSEIDRQTGFRTRNLLTLPMTAAGGELIGVFQVVNKRGGVFEAEDEEILSSLAATAAVVMERAGADR
jgi:serine/threonine-protein kinase